jgi:phenylacetate-CoA ligase
VEEALERDHWSRERWERWQNEQLTLLLDRAATRVPYYREQWRARRGRGDAASWQVLQNWPILEKESVRQNAKAFVADDSGAKAMFHEHTSGTTGKPLDLWWSRDTVRAWYALFEARWRRWYGVSRHDRWAILCGQLVAPVNSRKPPFWVWNAALNQLYMSSYHLAPDLIPDYLGALKKYGISYIFGYPSSLNAVAQEILRLQRDDLKLNVAITNAEPLFAHQRRAISRAFHCPVRETYGMAEIVAAASECDAGQLHLWPEVGRVEVLNSDKPVTSGAVGELVCTGLLNADMPLVRYRVGDRGGLGVDTLPCACGRSLAVLRSLDGRSDDVLYTEDGRAIGRLDPIFKEHLPVREAQIVQESGKRIRVRYVPDANFTFQNGQSIIQRLQARMGPVEVVLEEVNSIPRTRNGKFRAVINLAHAPLSNQVSS